MKSIAGSLSWIARSCGPDITYGVSKVQALAACGQVKDIKVAHKLVECYISTAERGETFKSGMLTSMRFAPPLLFDKPPLKRPPNGICDEKYVDQL